MLDKTEMSRGISDASPPSRTHGCAEMFKYINLKTRFIYQHLKGDENTSNLYLSEKTIKIVVSESCLMSYQERGSYLGRTDRFIGPPTLTIANEVGDSKLKIQFYESFGH